MTRVHNMQRAYSYGTNQISEVTRYRQFVAQVVFAGGFLSGINLFGDLSLTILVLALGLLLALLAGVRTPFLFPLAGVLGGVLVISVVFVAISQDTYGWVDERLFVILTRTLLALIILTTFYLAYEIVGGNVRILFEQYLKVAFVFAVLGIVQELVFLVFQIDIFGGLSTGAKEYGRFLGISGLSIEPAFYAAAIMPGAAFYLVRFIQSFEVSSRAVVVVLALVLSTSALGYLGIGFASALAFLILIPRTRAIVIVVAVPAVIFAVWWLFQFDFFQLRFRDSLDLLRIEQLTWSTGANLSSYSQAVNAAITLEAFQSTWGTGAGFGAYSYVYDAFISNYDVPSYRESLPGRGSATSFLLRIIAELGVVGIFLVLWVIGMYVRTIRGWLRFSSEPVADNQRAVEKYIASDGNYQVAVAIAGLASFIIILIRMGEYFENGILFVLLLPFLLNRHLRNRPGASRGTFND